MQASSAQNDPFWMVPQPIRWAAASVGGFLASKNPFRDHQEPPATETESSTVSLLTFC